jgi:hypothetical protein
MLENGIVIRPSGVMISTPSGPQSRGLHLVRELGDKKIGLPWVQGSPRKRGATSAKLDRP